MMDGLKLYLQASGNSDIQERYYNGGTHDHYVTSIFCFCPNGTILIAFFNVSGSVYDSQVAEMGQIYRKLEKVYERTGGSCCVDTFTSLVKTYWDHQLLPKLRGRSNYIKKRGEISKANG